MKKNLISESMTIFAFRFELSNLQILVSFYSMIRFDIDSCHLLPDFYAPMIIAQALDFGKKGLKRV